MGWPVAGKQNDGGRRRETQAWISEAPKEPGLPGYSEVALITGKQPRKLGFMDRRSCACAQPAQFQLAAQQELERLKVPPCLGHVVAPGIEAVAVDQVAP